MIFCENENKYRANTLAVETAESVEFSHREGITVNSVHGGKRVRNKEKDQEKEREFV